VSGVAPQEEEPVVPVPTLHHVDRGSGVPVLALHGWWPDHRLMLGCLEPIFAARPGYRRLYPDLPGMGATPAPAGVAGSDDVLSAVLAFVDEVIGERPFLLVGESYGGYLARGLVQARPGQVRGLALICPVATLEPGDRTLPPRQVLRADPGLLDGVEVGLAEGFAGMSVVQTARTLRRYRDEIQPGVDVADQEAMARIRLRWALSTDPDTGPAFDRPTLILTGRQDDCVGYADQLRWLPQYPRAGFAVLDVAGHNLQIEQPELFTALMQEWLDRVAAQS
jgi:pimeloyl-ACP methyl ester carboxylesterase